MAKNSSRKLDRGVIDVLGEALRKQSQIKKPKPMVKKVTKGELVQALRPEIAELTKAGYSITEISDFIRKTAGIKVSPSVLWKHTAKGGPKSEDAPAMPRSVVFTEAPAAAGSPISPATGSPTGLSDDSMPSTENATMPNGVEAAKARLLAVDEDRSAIPRNRFRQRPATDEL